MNSGSSANLVAALALAQQLQKENRPLRAITAAFTFPTTLSSLLIAGFDVQVVDTEENGFNLCPDALRKACHNFPPTLICVTHFLGFPAKIDEIKSIANQYKALILQDACETMDLKDNSKTPIHKLGDITTWSFYHPHHLSSYGGGAVICPNYNLHKLCDSIAHWGRACTCHLDPESCKAPKGFGHNFTYVNLGVNIEISEVNACFGRFQLQRWDDIEKKRKENYQILYNAISDSSSTVYPQAELQGSPFVFPVTVNPYAQDIIQTLTDKGIECRSLMGGAIIDQPAYQHILHDGCKNARSMSQNSFFVGIHQTLSTEHVQHVAKAIKESLRSLKSEAVILEGILKAK